MMKKIAMTLTIALAGFLAFTGTSLAQPRGGMMWRGSGGWGPGSQYNRIYDPKSSETIRGEVTKVDRITPTQGMSGGIHMLVKTDKETVSVHLGPSWYLENQDVKIEPKDTVEVKGSRVTFGGQPALIASEVRKGNEILTLRDEAGFPAWMAWRRR